MDQTAAADEFEIGLSREMRSWHDFLSAISGGKVGNGFAQKIRWVSFTVSRHIRLRSRKRKNIVTNNDNDGETHHIRAPS
jgi:hypothetical protein